MRTNVADWYHRDRIYGILHRQGRSVLIKAIACMVAALAIMAVVAALPI